MDLLLLDPPYKALKGVGSEHGYSIGLLSLATYLAEHGFVAKVLTGNLLLELPATESLTFKVSQYAEGQRLYSESIADDSHLIWNNITEYIKELRPKAVGLTFLTPASELVYKIAHVIKQYDEEIKIIVGGHHPTFCPDDVIMHRCIDFVVRGEGEIPLLQLMQQLILSQPDFTTVPGLTYRREGEIVHNQDKVFIDNLDALPLPDRSLVLNCDFKRNKGHYITTARGCPYTCSFCSDRTLWSNKVRRRSVDNVISEIIYLSDHFELDYIDITDGTFTYDKAYVKSFCDALIEQKIGVRWRCTARYDNIDEELVGYLKSANCKALYFGLESGSEKTLKQYNKNTNIEGIVKASDIVYRSGIKIITSVLIGLPQETAEDIEQTLNLMKKIKSHIFDINSYIPLPGTDLYREMPEAEIKELDWSKIGYKSYMNFFSSQLTEEQLNNYLMEAYAIAEETLRKFAAKGSWREK